MNSSLPFLKQEPINLMKMSCQKAIKQISNNYSPTKSNFYISRRIKPNNQRKLLLPSFSSKIKYSEMLQSLNEPLGYDFKPKKLNNYKNFCKLHLEVQKTEESIIIPLNKWHGPQKQIQSSQKKSLKEQEQIQVNLKQRNSQSLMVIKTKQLEEMKKLQKIIKDVITKQDYQMNHHFDSLQEELSS